MSSTNDFFAAGVTAGSRSPRGFTLIELLVAVLVLAVGVLGTVGLQFNGIRHAHNSHLRSQASILAFDMADRMRANIPSVDDGDYAAITGTETNPGYDCSSTFPAGQTTCTSAELGAVDTYLWNRTIKGDATSGLDPVLPAGNGTVTCTSPCAAGSLHTITVTWTERETAGGATPSSAASHTFSIVITP